MQRGLCVVAKGRGRESLRDLSIYLSIESVPVECIQAPHRICLYLGMIVLSAEITKGGNVSYYFLCVLLM